MTAGFKDDPRPTVRYKKGDDHAYINRWYVHVEDPEVGDVDVGWAVKNSDGWAFYSTPYESIKGVVLASGYKTRVEAVAEGLSTLRIRYLSRVYRLNTTTWHDEAVYLNGDHLHVIWDRLLDEHYGLTPERKAQVERIMAEYRTSHGV